MDRPQDMTGVLYGVGVGPGAPDLLTVRAAELLARVSVVVSPSSAAGDSLARRSVAHLLSGTCTEIPMRVPMTTDPAPAQAVYDDVTAQIETHLQAGRDVAVLCEGDPFFYGSFMYLYARLADQYRIEVIPGLSAITAAAAVAGMPLVARNDVLIVLPAPLPDERLQDHLIASDAVVLLKVGRHWPRIRALLQRLDLLSSAQIVSHATRSEQQVRPAVEVPAADVPYFSVLLLRKRAHI